MQNFRFGVLELWEHDAKAVLTSSSDVKVMYEKLDDISYPICKHIDSDVLYL